MNLPILASTREETKSTHDKLMEVLKSVEGIILCTLLILRGSIGGSSCFPRIAERIVS
jgi:hypothetical protein